MAKTRVTRQLVFRCLLYAGLLNLRIIVLADERITDDETIIDSQPVLRFCYEDKQMLPYYTGDTQETPTQPGATIEHIEQATQQSGVLLQLIRRPWLRCLQKLKENSADALVATFDADRAHFTVYPQLPDGEPDNSRAINQLGLCLVYHFDNPLPQKLNAPDTPITLARPHGYMPLPFPENTVLVAAHSPGQALELVLQRRVDTTTVLCQLNGIDAMERKLHLMPLKLLYPPLHLSYGYLMLSKSFYQRYPQHAERLWQTLPKTLIKQRYLDYLNYPDQ
jgi:polar amino acid transport system substrate-binding protein